MTKEIDLTEVIDAVAFGLAIGAGLSDQDKATMRCHRLPESLIIAIADDPAVRAAVSRHLDSVPAMIKRARTQERDVPGLPAQLPPSGGVRIDGGPPVAFEALCAPGFVWDNSLAFLALLNSGVRGEAVHDLPAADPVKMGLPGQTHPRLAALIHALATGSVDRSLTSEHLHPQALMTDRRHVGTLGASHTIEADRPTLIMLTDLYVGLAQEAMRA